MTGDVPREHREPFFDVPSVIGWLVAAIIVVHVVRALLPATLDSWLVGALGFIPLRYDGIDLELPGGMASAIASPFSHFFVHGDVVHLAVNSAMLLAFGGFVARRNGTVSLLAFVASCSMAGALLFYLVSANRDATMIGASGGISGLMAAAMRLLSSAITLVPDRRAGELLRRATPLIPLKPITRLPPDPMIVWTTVIWFTVNLLAAFGIGTPGEASIAWEAHIGGFVAGLLLYGAFDGGARDDGRSRAVEADGDRVEGTGERENSDG